MPPQLRRWDLGLVLASSAVWALLGLWAQPELADLRCKHEPELCSVETLNALDRSTVHLQDRAAKRASDWIQNGSGVAAALVPLALHATRAALGATPWGMAWAAWGTDMVLLLEGTVLNGVINTLVRIGVQRPRPGAYRTPTKNGASPSQYTSFYSGHTSFVAVAVLTVLFSLMGRLKRGSIEARAGLAVTAAVGLTLLVAVGTTRVLGGAHFPTDVLAAPWVPLILCFTLAIAHRPKTEKR